MKANDIADMVEKEPYHTNLNRITIANFIRQQSLEIQALHQILGHEGIEVGKDYLDECVVDLRKAQDKSCL